MADYIAHWLALPLSAILTVTYLRMRVVQNRKKVQR